MLSCRCMYKTVNTYFFVLEIIIFRQPMANIVIQVARKWSFQLNLYINKYLFNRKPSIQTTFYFFAYAFAL